MRGTAVRRHPFFDPPVHPDPAAELRPLIRRAPRSPRLGDGLRARAIDPPFGDPALRIECVRIVQLDPISAIIFAVITTEFSVLLFEHEIHPLRSLEIPLPDLRTSTLPETDLRRLHQR